MCKECGSTFLEDNPFTFQNFRNSYALINRIMKQLKNLDLTFLRIAELNNVSITIVQRYLDSYVTIPALRTLPESLGIDEIHSNMSASDSAYLCILFDNEKTYPIDILPSRSKRKLSQYFEKFPKSERDKVKFVTIDMWLPYKEVALKNFKNCKIAVDPFHVVENLTRPFEKLRVEIMNQCPKDSDSYYLLKKWNFLLEKTDIDLDNEPQYNGHFKRKLTLRQLKEMLLGISDILLEAYELKEDYRLFNEKATSEDCEVWLDELITKFSSCSIPKYYEFTNTLINWRQEIINSFERPYENRKLTNARTENFNGQVRVYMDLSRGISNFDRFRKRVLFAFNDSIFYSITNRLSSNKRDKKPRGKYNKTK